MSEKKPTAKTTKAAGYTAEQLRAASDTARARVSAEMSDTAWSAVVETVCKLHLRYTMAALEKGVGV